MKKPTLEEISKLVSFTRNSLGTLKVEHVKGAVWGNIEGNVWGNIQGDVEGEVKGNVQGNIEGSVWGDIKGDILGGVWGDIGSDIGGRVFGNIEGDVEGNVHGSVKGSDGLEHINAELQQTINNLREDGRELRKILSKVMYALQDNVNGTQKQSENNETN